MGTSTDVAIIGGGAIGSSIAYFLASDPAFDGHMTVIERDPTYRQASSALSASSIRQQFSTPENIRMSRFGFGFLAEAGRNLAVDGEDAMPVDVGLKERGYLYLAAPGRETAMREIHDVQEAEGAPVVLLSPAELAGRFPWLVSTASAWDRSASTARAGSTATASCRHSAGRPGRSASSTSRRKSSASVSRAGALSRSRWATARRWPAGRWSMRPGRGPREVAAMVGIALPVEARRRSVFMFDARSELADCPLVIDTTGVWFRPEGDGFICGISPAEAEDLPGLPARGRPAPVRRRDLAGAGGPRPGVRRGQGEPRVGRLLRGQHVRPQRDPRRSIPDVTNFYFANGFSGHGIQQSPAVGRAIAELIVHGRYVSLDLSIFAYERIAAGRPVIERNVIG